MKTLLLSALIGFFAGVIDVIPMIIQKLNKKACVSAFLQYFFVSIVILNINLPLPWFLKGSIVSFCLILPTIIIISNSEKKALPIIIINSIVLGFAISILGYFFMR